jgi:acetoin utilization deacetylase AcuC-like enzyme
LGNGFVSGPLTVTFGEFVLILAGKTSIKTDIFQSMNLKMPDFAWATQALLALYTLYIKSQTMADMVLGGSKLVIVFYSFHVF